MGNPLLSAALWYAKKDWYIFPLRPGEKLPLTTHGFKDASTDAGQIHKWWSQWPDANIGVATGESGLVVADLDVKNNAPGMESWAELRARHGPEIENTAISETPTGGSHVVYKANGAPIRNSASKLAPGIDIRAQGGYIVAPPSRLPGGDYSWAMNHAPTEIALMEIPPALADALAEPGHIPAMLSDDSPVIGQGSRNDALASIAGAMRAKGTSPEAIYAALQVVNDQQCSPPLPDDEVRKIAESIGRYKPREPEFNLTDLGDALRFLHLEGENVRYVHAWNKWLVWDDMRWRVDDTDEVEIKAICVVKHLLNQAAACEDPDQRKPLARHARACESLSKRRAFLVSAQPYCAVTPDQLDQKPWLLNTLSGTVDLRTGTMRPHDQADMLTKLAPVTYEPDATCPAWLAFQASICGGDQALITFKQKAFGYGLTGDVSEQVFFMHYGTGSNGKSTELNLIRDVMGPDYSQHTGTETLLVKRGGGVPNDIAKLKGARFVTAIEAEAGRHMAEALVKQLTGGDTLTARFLYGEFFEFKPTHKIYLAANHKPEIRGTDHAMWRRIRLVPYLVTIPDDEQDKQLPDKLLAEAPGILAWMVQGCLDWQAHGLKPPQAVVEATESYRNEMDALGEFIADRCVLFPGAQGSCKELYDAYSEWAGENGEKDVISKKMFTLRLLERGGIQRQRVGPSRTRGYQGIGLKGSAVQPDVFEEADSEPDTDSIPF